MIHSTSLYSIHQKPNHSSLYLISIPTDSPLLSPISIPAYSLSSHNPSSSTVRHLQPSAETKGINKTVDPINDSKYEHILESFAEKLVKERPSLSFVMAASNSSYLHTDAQTATPGLLPS
ncbi:hypothetical protein RYX36_034964 [Vicia faba]